MRVAVIGAGVIGASVGWHLSRRGVDVLFLDRGEPGAGVSDWTFSWVNASNKTQTRDYFDLSVAGMSAHYRLAAQVGADGWWHPTGHVRWADPGETTEALRARISLLTSWGYDVVLWEAEQVRRLLEPCVRFPTDDTPVAVYLREGWIDGRALATKLVGDALRHGARAVFGGAAREIVTAEGRVTAVVTSDAEHHRVDAVVNAAGPDGDKIAELVGRTLPMRYQPGLIAKLSCGHVPIQRTMHAPHVELRPAGHGQLLAHSRELDDGLVSHDRFPPELLEELHARAVDALPVLAGSPVLGARAVSRPIPADGFPSVGAFDDVPGYYEAIAHSGITLAAVIGDVLACEIVDGEISPLIRPYRPGRLGTGAPAASSTGE
ncbi:MAG TPA: FAD-dependent oxidoreductase [Actinocrinis sp.]|jgi:glycine/D-amino acid oxidase-like deaminating enzyme